MKTYEALYKLCQRRTKTEGDADALAGFKEDLNIGVQEIAGLRGWQELEKQDTLTLSASTETYALTSLSGGGTDVDFIRQITITSPTANETVVNYIDKEKLRVIDPVTSNSGTGTPLYWYYSEPTISSGTETRNVSFWPIPDATYVVRVAYKRILTDMSATSDYPFFDRKFHHILADYAIWCYCLREPDATLNPSTFEAAWENGKRRLLSSVHSQAPLEAITGPDGP